MTRLGQRGRQIFNAHSCALRCEIVIIVLAIVLHATAHMRQQREHQSAVCALTALKVIWIECHIYVYYAVLKGEKINQKSFGCIRIDDSPSIQLADNYFCPACHAHLWPHKNRRSWKSRNASSGRQRSSARVLLSIFFFAAFKHFTRASREGYAWIYVFSLPSDTFVSMHICEIVFVSLDKQGLTYKSRSLDTFGSYYMFFCFLFEQSHLKFRYVDIYILNHKLCFRSHMIHCCPSISITHLSHICIYKEYFNISIAFVSMR